MSAFSQTSSGDLDLSTGNLVVSQDVAQNTAWKLSNLFNLFKGEFFRDTRIGFPALQYVFVKNPNLDLIISLLNRVLKMPPGVAAVQDISMDYVSNQRSLACDMTVATVTGQLVSGGLGVPFIVQDNP